MNGVIDGEHRKHLRYRYETCHLAKVRFPGQGPAPRPVLIANVSHSGCNLIAIAEHEEVQAGDEVVLQFDAQDYATVRIVRVESLTPRALRLGCQFLD